MRTWFAALIIVVLIAGCAGQAPANNMVFSGTDFAKCLSQSGVKMYTASWCESCQNQKQLFGEGWEYVNKVDCGVPGENETFNQICTQAGLPGVPVWELKNGTRIRGPLTTYQLNLLTGCTGMVLNNSGSNAPGNGITFAGPPPLTATVNQPFTFSLCQPPPPIDATCGGLRPATNPTGGKPPYSMSVKLGGGFLPPGIALNLDGWLTGTPTKEGTYPFTVCARDGFGEEGCVAVTITVQPAQTPSPPPAPEPAASAVEITSVSCKITNVNEYGDTFYLLEATGTASASRSDATLGAQPATITSCGSWETHGYGCIRGSGPEQITWTAQEEEHTISTYGSSLDMYFAISLNDWPNIVSKNQHVTCTKAS